MELPNYRMPGAKNVGLLLWDKAKDFLQRAFTVIFMATLAIWFLQTFSLRLNIFTDSKDSIPCYDLRPDRPINASMGLGDWRIATALITGFFSKGKRCFPRCLSLFGKTSTLVSSMTSLSAASLLVFCLLYTPCVAAIASIRESWVENGH